MINPELLKIGQKIRNFRLRSGLSQLDLENKIEAAPGSLSRIESGQVNPSKETLLKIVDVLNLNVNEALVIYNLDFLDFPGLWKVASDLSSDLDFDTTMQSAVDIVTKEMNFIGGVIFRYDKENKQLIPWFHTNSKLINLVAKWLAQDFRKYIYSLDLVDHPIVKAFTSKTIQFSKGLESLGPVVESSYVKYVGKFLNAKKSVAIPIYKNEEGLGVLWFAFAREIITEEETKLLKILSDHIAIAISNSIKYHEAIRKEIK